MLCIFAHRGAESSAPENTLAAFKTALNSGAKALELDVQLSKDQIPVVIHDYKLTRYNKEYNESVNEYTLSELKDIDIGSFFSTEFKDERIPTLKEVLELTPQSVMLNIEIKNTPKRHIGIEQKIADLISEYRTIDNVLVSSFDHLALENIGKINPQLKLGFLIHYPLINAAKYVNSTGLNVVSIHPNKNIVDEKFIEECQKYNYKVFPYTVKNDLEYQTLIDLGVDGMFTSKEEYY
ncbi:glycerophosphodiester phosphodiesterase [Jeotgalicoccus meleagridis]|uniref:Glycerophosphoryl diester phosphodiesterase n=1 Tax=Jeotgalicoccus meleagridis TaxID=2759181 RepID=A0A6V7RMN2_9STAP|nr:glycerophosphodiester phosphodiesterase family protein [Jeotgalicoccus meleagridis]CAD2079656.1 Glycerophosphoryl diester phosphodiesterase [Jeotgalicoccus meleagridis]HIW38413.1 glycerophosphodiester phosphodiesterase [Candidatus Jeotgalicoccus stercoravium]